MKDALKIIIGFLLGVSLFFNAFFIYRASKSPDTNADPVPVAEIQNKTHPIYTAVQSGASNTEQTKTQEPEKTQETRHEASYNDITITYLGCEYDNSYDGGSCVILFFELENMSSEPRTYFSSGITIEARQNGAKLDVSRPANVWYSEIADDAKEVGSGDTLSFARVHKITSKEPIEIRLLAGDNETMLYNFSINQGERNDKSNKTSVGQLERSRLYRDGRKGEQGVSILYRPYKIRCRTASRRI